MSWVQVTPITALSDLGPATPGRANPVTPSKDGPHRAFATNDDGISQVLAAKLTVLPTQ